MVSLAWKNLDKAAVGRYAEYYVKMEMTARKFEIYVPELDDHGVDFLARRRPGPYLEIQVKAIRQPGYVFLRKKHFPLGRERFLIIVRLTEDEAPALHLIPSLVWQTPDDLFVSREYGAPRVSDPEWGISLSALRMSRLAPYRLDQQLEFLARDGLA